VKRYDELFVSIPKEFPLKTLQLSCKVFLSSPQKAEFAEGRRNLCSPEPCSAHTAGKRGRGSTGLEPMKAKHGLEKTPELHNSLSAHVFFSSSQISCLPSLRLKLKKPIKCLSYSIFLKGSDIKLFGEQLFLGVRTADESLFLSSSVFKAKIPYRKR